MSQSSIFINEPTVVDHSYITQSGRIEGGSVNPSFVVTGSVTVDENVVLDFSKAKNLIKKLIDDDNGGFDHKCWIVRGYSYVTSIVDVNTREIIHDWSYLESVADPDRLLAVTTPHIQIRAPKSAFRFVARGWTPSDRVNMAIEVAMEDWLCANMPGFDVKVAIRETPVPFNPSSEVCKFRYVHGLKHSSSWGCQNIAHGHLSFVDFDAVPNGQTPEFVQNIKASIAKELNDTIFISAENFSTTEHFVEIGYESTSRGRFEMSINKNAPQKYVVLETETTIEHIIEYVAARFKTQLKYAGATRLYVSEGLSKGAIINLEHE